MTSEWRELPFSRAVVVNPTVRLVRGDDYPFVDMKAVSASSRSVAPSETRSFRGGGSRFEVGDTLMARITPCLENGKIARFYGDSNQAGHGSTEFIVIRGREGVSDTTFAYYLTKWEGVSGYAISQMSGTSGRQRVPTSALDHLVVPVPPLSEQRAIAHILGTLDDKIELNRRMSETLEAMARALFKSWFVDFDPVRAKIEGRDPGLPKHIADLFPVRLVDSELGEIPEGWEVKPLSDCVDVARGLSYKGSGLSDEGVPMHNLNSIYEGGGYKEEGLKRYNDDYKAQHVVRAGDLIVANTEQGHDRLLIGYAAIVPARFGEESLFSHHIYRVRPKVSSKLTADYLCHLLNTRVMHDIVSGYANGTTVNMLSVDGLQSPLIVVPPAHIISVFSSIAEVARMRHEDMVEESHRILVALRDALLPKLISGDLRVDDTQKFIGRGAS